MALIQSAKNGTLLQTIFTNGVRNQINADFEDWKNIKSYKIAKNTARDIKFAFQTSYGLSAVQDVDAGANNRAYPQGQEAPISEYTAVLKQSNATLEINYDVYKRAMETPTAVYMKPLEYEINSKKTATQRLESASLQLDGTGVYGTVASVDETNIATGEITVTLDITSTARGSVTVFGYKDLLQVFTPDAATDRLAAAGVAALSMENADRDTSVITFNLQDANGNTLTSVVSTGIVAGDVIYRNKNAVDLTSPISDYNTISNSFAGLETLTANDGRVVHGITMSGATSGSRIDGQAQPLELNLINKALDKAKLRAGEQAYTYDQMLLAPEAHSKITNDREASRQFQTVMDNARGGPVFKFMHRNSALTAVTSEFCRRDRIWMCPKTKADSKKVLELHGTDYENVRAPGQSEFMLKPSASGTYSNMVVSFMTTYRTLICKHPAAIAVVENFTI